jgi:hypothetical protein
MTISLNISSKSFSDWPSFSSRPTDQFFPLDSPFDNNLFNSMLFEWNEQRHLPI